ncbi:MAG TPA: hypothetical protein VFW07_03110 [Parafilimonas sp.]|nr:hypothetical protein [Parafilimonas sp.]
MTGNTYQNFRRKFIEDCLRNTCRDFTKETIKQNLLEEYESFANKPFSDRTFEIDWQFIKTELEAEGLRLKKWKKGPQWFYRYSDATFSIFNEGLNKEEIKKLAEAIKLLQ